MDGPLAGMRVLDLTNYLSGPYCAMLLGDLGAEVIKIENLDGDPSRRAGPPFINGVSSYFLLLNRNKKSIRLNLKSEDGRDLFFKLVRTADAIVENFRPGVADRLGIGHDHVKRERPEIVYCAISGFGETGPRADQPAFDHVMQGFSGWMSITGTPESGPLRTGPSVGDIISGLFATIGVLGALLGRERTGRGQKVATSLLESLVATLIPHLSEYLATGISPAGGGNSHPILVPFGTFPTADGFINIAVASGEQWQALCRVLGLKQFFGDEELTNNAGRAKRRDEVHQAISEATRSRPRNDWLDAFNANGVPCAPINSIAEALNDPQSVHNQSTVEMDHPVAGRYKTVNNPLRMDRKSSSEWAYPPLLGEHTSELLAGLGLSAGEIDKLRGKKVI